MRRPPLEPSSPPAKWKGGYQTVGAIARHPCWTLDTGNRYAVRDFYRFAASGVIASLNDTRRRRFSSHSRNLRQDRLSTNVIRRISANSGWSRSTACSL